MFGTLPTIRLVLLAVAVGLGSSAWAGAPLLLDLATARSLARERQPAVAAARASLAAAVGRKQALEQLRVPDCLQADLPVRRKQANLGTACAHAGVHLAEINSVYAAQYCYVSYLFAQTQLRLTKTSIGNLEELDRVLVEVARGLEEKQKNPDSEFDTELLLADRERVRAMIRLAQARGEEALSGCRRALSALREALHLPEDCEVRLAHEDLFDVLIDLDGPALVALAMAHRPEICQVTLAAEMSSLEVTAQQSRKHALTVRTFASGGDIHAQPIPAGSYLDEYKPGAVGPEMPPTINGHRCDRVAIASSYAERAGAVVEKTRGLLRLEVEQAILRYQEASGRLRELQVGVQHAEKATAGLREKMDLGRGSRARLESLLNTGILGTQLRSQVNEARYQMLVALIALERATAGTFAAPLEGHRAPCPSVPLTTKGP